MSGLPGMGQISDLPVQSGLDSGLVSMVGSLLGLVSVVVGVGLGAGVMFVCWSDVISRFIGWVKIGLHENQHSLVC